MRNSGISQNTVIFSELQSKSRIVDFAFQVTTLQLEIGSFILQEKKTEMYAVLSPT